MACSDEYSRLISLYPLSEDQTPEERAKLEAHIQECAVCRADLEQWRDFLDLIPPAKDVEVPQWVKERVHTNVMKAVRRDRALRALKRAACLVFASAAAVAVLAAGWMYLRGELSGSDTTPGHRIAARPSAEKTQGAPSVGVGGREIARPASDSQPHESEAPLEHPTPATQDAKIASKRQASLDEEFAAAATPAGALSLLERTLKAANDGEDVDLQRVIGLAEKLRAQWPASEESAKSLELISRCYTGLGEIDRARKSFLLYADAMAELSYRQQPHVDETGSAIEERGDLAVHTIQREADRLFGLEDYLSALFYYDTIRTRSRGKPAAQYAQLMSGHYYANTRQYAQAEKEFKQLISEHPDSRWASAARTSLPAILANRKHYAEAVAVWQEAADATENTEEKASAYMNKGALVVLQGPDHYPEALAIWNRILKEYPGARCTPTVKGMIQQVQRRVTDDVSGQLMQFDR